MFRAQHRKATGPFVLSGTRTPASQRPAQTPIVLETHIFYIQGTTTTGITTMTKSIPINKSSNQSLSAEETETHRLDVMLADYKDYVFYSRVVEGMRRAQDHTRDIALRYENQAVIDRLVRTRHFQCAPPPQAFSSSPTSVRNFGDDSSKSSHGNLGEIRRIRSRTDLRLSETMDLGQAPLEETDLFFDMDL